MRYLSVILLSGLLIVLPSCKYFKGGLFGRKARALAIEKAQNDSVRLVDSLQKVKVRLMEIENARIDSLKKADEERQAFQSKHKYNIIVGSFITPEYAKMMSEGYRQQGYDPRILKMEGSRFELVAVEGHNSFKKAVARLNQFQDTVQIESWLYVKK